MPQQVLALSATLRKQLKGADLPAPMGHSFGGIFVQLLLDAGYGRAGVSIDGGGTKGVLATPLTEIKAALPIVGNPANKDRAVTMTEEQFHYAFTNNLTPEES